MENIRVRSELLTEITEAEAKRYESNDAYGCEEKHNGERRIIHKGVTSGIRNFNREGNPGKALPSHVINALQCHPLPSFTIDCEFEKGIVVVLDVLNLGGLDFSGQRYDKRKEAALLAFENRSPLIKVCKTITGKAKAAFVQAKRDEKAEGVCFKKLDAPFKQGRSGSHLKLKFVKDMDVVVLGPSPEGHNSVRVGVYDEHGVMMEICGVSLNGKPNAVKGDVLCIKYLYASQKDGVMHAVQPRMLFVRDDKRASECTTAQMVVNKNFRSN